MGKGTLSIFGDMARSPSASVIPVGDHADSATPPYWLALVMLLSFLFWSGVISAMFVTITP